MGYDVMEVISTAISTRSGQFILARVALALAAIGLLGQSSCTGIAIQPSCPAELIVGETGSVFANQRDEGAIATYKWEVFPTEAGSLTTPTAPASNFLAEKEGDATFRITASDGLYQVISECPTRIIAFSNIAVSLAADSVAVDVGTSVTLTCETQRQIDSATLTISQVEGATVELSSSAQGVATFTPGSGEELSFTCTAQNGSGEQALSDPLLVTVTPAPGGQTGGNDNQNDNGSTPPPTGRR